MTVVLLPVFSILVRRLTAPCHHWSPFPPVICSAVLYLFGFSVLS
jgi:hypothetical protein